MTVVIAGCGDLGVETGLRLIARGVGVQGLRRRAELLPPAIRGIAVDLAAQRVDLPGETDAVVIATAAEDRGIEAYRRAYVEALTGVLDGIDRLPEPPRRVLLVSSTSVYGVDDGGWVDEQTAPSAGSGTAAVLVESEEIFRRRVPGGVILRLGGIYGPGRDRLIEQVRAGLAGARQVSAGQAGVQQAEPPGQDAWVNLIHRDDAAAAIAHLLLDVSRPASVYLGVDGTPVTRSELMRFLAAELGMPGDHDGPGEVAAAREPGHGKRCRPDALLATGLTMAYPDYRAGYRALIAGVGTRHR